MAYEVRYGSINHHYCDWKSCDCETYDKAMDYAWECACDDYDSYVGLHGIRDTCEIIKDGDADTEEEAWEVFLEERESCLMYGVREVE